MPLTDKHFENLQTMIHRCMGNMAAAGSIEDRVIQAGIMRAACTDYLAEHKPDKWADFGQHVSRVVQHSKRKKFNKKTLF